MALAFNWQNNSYGVAAATSVAVAKGANTITSGDLLIIVVSVENQAATDPGSITPPSGWTQITAGSITGNTWVRPTDNDGVRTGLFYRYADGAEGSSFTFSWTNSNVSSWAILDYTGSTSSPFDAGVETDHISGYTGSFVAPAITTATANDFEIFIWSVCGVGGTMTMPGGSVNTRVNQAGNNSTKPWIAVADLSIPTAGAQATQTATYQFTTDGYETVSFGIKPGVADILYPQACL